MIEHPEKPTEQLTYRLITSLLEDVLKVGAVVRKLTRLKLKFVEDQHLMSE